MKLTTWNVAKVVWLSVLVMMIGFSPAVGFQHDPPQSEIYSLESAGAAMDAEFSYQGVLKSNGTPVNGVRNFLFQIHDNGSCTNMLQEIVKTGVQVTEGRFSVNLLVRHRDFNGQKLWLQVVMGTSTRLMCKEILAVPYALSIKPGAEVDNTNAAVTINTFDGAKSIAKGIEAVVSGGNTSYGVIGVADNTAGAGVYAVSNTATADALYARNTHGGLAGNFNGNVAQNADAYGLVKAGARLYCGGGGFSLHQQFGPHALTGNSPVVGECEINFGFDISSRFWVVTPGGTSAATVACGVGINNNVLECTRFNVSGTATSGVITILIY